MDSVYFEGVPDITTGTIWGLNGVVSLVAPVAAVEAAVMRQQTKADKAEAAKSVSKIPQEQLEISRRYLAASRTDPSLRVAGTGKSSKKEPVFMMPRSSRRRRV